MSGDLFVLVALGSLLAFILWEMWANRRSALARRAKAADGLVPAGSAREVALFVLAAVFLACSMLAFASPDLAASQRHGSLLGMLAAKLGPLAAPLLFLLAAVGVFVSALAVRRRRLAAARGADHAG